MLQRDKFIPLHSSTERISFDDINSILPEAEKFKHAVMWNTDSVKAADASKIQLSDNLIELRAFNESEELHIMKVDGKFIGRIRKDGIGDAAEVLEEAHLLWGNPKIANGSVSLTEARGVEIKLESLDFEGADELTNPNCRVFVLVRNYAYTDNNARFGFNDFRFVKFFTREVHKDE